MSSAPSPATWAVDPTRVADQFRTSCSDGLSIDEARRRLETHGPNRIDAAPRSSWLPILAAQLTSPLTLILVVAVVISFGIGERLDAAVIAAIVVMNALLGFSQEWRAGHAIDALASMLQLRSRVVRSGERTEIDASEIVPGDLVEISPGDRVPADLRLVVSRDLLIDESALTGEPVGVPKSTEALPAPTMLADRSCIAHAGTDVRQGVAQGIVVATGAATEFGRIAELTATAEQPPIPLQQSLAAVGRLLGVCAVAVSALTTGAGILAGRDPSEMFITGISLAVAIVPEGLPAVVTVTLALGIQSMAKRRALLRHLEAAETLGAASTICTDKTGTLTQNQMTVRRIWTADGFVDAMDVGATTTGRTRGALLATAQICNHASITPTSGEIGDPTEVALLRLAADAGAPPPTEQVVDEMPFDSSTKVMAVVVDAPTGARVGHIKGAPEVLLARSAELMTDHGVVEIDDAARQMILGALSDLTGAGLRTLALAQRQNSPARATEAAARDLKLVGVVGLHDPPRPEATQAIADAGSAGITVVVVTGDATGTALAISREVGLPTTEAITGGIIDELDDDQLLDRLDGRTVLARVTPAHKMRVVRALQDRGDVVAMTGDGVNDAPALEQASIGIAMGQRGTDIARASSDVVLADDNFASIIAAIEEGRRQYANIRKFIRYLLSSNLGEVVAITGSVLLGWPLILLPAQILWMNLLTDGVTALALGAEPAEADLMRRSPRNPNDAVVDRAGRWWILGMGTLIGIGALAVFRFSLGSGTDDDLARAQTLAFTAMVLMEKMNVLNFRSERQPLWRLGLVSNPWLSVAWLGAIGAQIAAVHLPGLSDALGTTPLRLVDWLALGALAVPILVVGELTKSAIRRRDD